MSNWPFILLALVLLLLIGGVCAFKSEILPAYVAGTALVAIYLLVFGIAGSSNAPEAGDVTSPGGRYRRR